MKTVFVTVGTTSFDELIESITCPETVQALKARGYECLVLQVGRGSLLPAADSCPHIRLEAYRFKDSIAEDMKQADLVISHAGHLVVHREEKFRPFRWTTMGPYFGKNMNGAGSCLEALGAGKPLLVVVNDKLMNNHQLEMARQLHMDSHLLYCTCSTLIETLRTMDLSVLQPFLPGQPKNFANFLDKALGVQ